MVVPKGRHKLSVPTEKEAFSKLAIRKVQYTEGEGKWVRTRDLVRCRAASHKLPSPRCPGRLYHEPTDVAVTRALGCHSPLILVPL